MLTPKANEIDKLVVIAGCQRSGTTLIHRLLSAHPDVHGVMTDTAVFNNYDQFAKLTGISEPKTLAEMRAILTTLLTNSHVSKWQLELDDVLDRAHPFAPSWDSIFLCLLESLKEKFKLPVTALKHPYGEFAFAHLRDLFQNRKETVRFVYCLRNPFDTYRSWKHRSTSWFDQDRPECLPLRWCAMWLESTTEVMEFKLRFPNDVKVFRFTDLLNSPEAFTADLCEFVGIDDHTSLMLEKIDDKPNSSFRDTNLPKVAGGVVDVRARVNDLSPWEIDVIRAACGKRAAVFGYQLGEPSDGCDAKRIVHDVFLEHIPTTELIRYGWRLVTRRVWNRCFKRRLTCVVQPAVENEESERSKVDMAAVSHE